MALATAGCSQPQSAPTQTLKELAATRGTTIGAYYQFPLADDSYDRLFERELNAVAVWAWGGGPASYDFAEGDRVVDWGIARGMEVRGAHLIWFDDIPVWVNATPLEGVETAMNDIIDTVVGHYAGRIQIWNVVNEPVDDAGKLRLAHKWAQAMGPEYIGKAFLRARAKDPAAVLQLNEFDIESNTAKYAATKALLKSLLDKGIPVHALGWQLHLKPLSFDPATLLARMNEIADLGLDNYITELDVELPPQPTPEDYEMQKQTYRSVIEVFLAARRHRGIMTWGLRDGDPDWLTNNHPFPFDERLEKKPAYYGLQEAFEKK